jgi:hypothetical protein
MLLLDRLKESAPARIITTAPETHRGVHNHERLGAPACGHRRNGELLPPGAGGERLQEKPQIPADDRYWGSWSGANDAALSSRPAPKFLQ